MSGSQRMRAAVVVASAIAGTLLALGVAEAAKLSGKEETVPLPNDSDVHLLTLECPAGSEATGGGIRLEDDLNDFVQGTYPAGEDGWTVAAFRRDTLPDASSFTGLIRCWKSSRVTSVQEKVDLPDPLSLVTAFAECPPGTKVSGGGGQLGDDVNDYLSGSYPYSSRKWVALGHGSATMASHAVCVKGSKLKYRSKSITMPNDDATHEVTAKCPKRTWATGGGGRVENPLSEYFQGSYPSGKRKWTAAGYDDGELTAYVVCRKT